jgi:ribonuclease G
MGRVIRVLPECSPLDIGAPRRLLHVADIWGSRQDGAAAKPIERLLAEGRT